MSYRTQIILLLIIGAAAALVWAAAAIFAPPVALPRIVAPTPAVGTVITVGSPEFVVAFSIPDGDFCDACEIVPGGTLTVMAAGPEKAAAAYKAPEQREFSQRPCRDGAIVIVEARRFLNPGLPTDAGALPPAGRLDSRLGRLLTGRRCPTIISPFFGQPE